LPEVGNGLGGGVLYTYVTCMENYNKTKTRFKKLIRIDQNQLKWIQANKITKTDAGQLDIIINFYKKNRTV